MAASTVAFAYDSNLDLGASVTAFTLLTKSLSPCRVVVLYSSQTLPAASRESLSQVVAASPIPHSISFLDIGTAFTGAYQVRDITVPTYYRLLLPELLPDTDQVLYLDVDTVVTRDLRPLMEVELGNHLLAGVKAVYPNRNPEHLRSLEIEPGTYINAGVLLMNLGKMRQEGLQPRFLELAKKDFTFQDQDILNLTCRGKIHYLPPAYNVHAMFDYRKDREYADQLFGSEAVDEALDDPKIIHYAGNKPWNGADCFFYDQWWEAYRYSPAFDRDFYLDHQRNLIRSLAESARNEDSEGSPGFSGQMSPRPASRLRRWLSKALSTRN